MANIKGKDTKPEIMLRKALWKRGFRYRLHYKLPGKPDIVFVSAKVSVFVDGCFWHGCPEHSTRPKTNRVFWDKKISGNKKRDRAVNRDLKRLSWIVLRFWEHEINDDVDKVATHIERVVQRQRS